jgi:hypothetical protein
LLRSKVLFFVLHSLLIPCFFYTLFIWFSFPVSCRLFFVHSKYVLSFLPLRLSPLIVCFASLCLPFFRSSLIFYNRSSFTVSFYLFLFTILRSNPFSFFVTFSQFLFKLTSSILPLQVRFSYLLSQVNNFSLCQVFASRSDRLCKSGDALSHVRYLKGTRNRSSKY